MLENRYKYEKIQKNNSSADSSESPLSHMTPVLLLSFSVAPDIETNLIFNLIPNLISGLSGSGHIFHYQPPNLISGYNLILGSQPDIRLLFSYIRLISGSIRPDI